MSQDLNIFSTLGKYSSATDENYLTESFVFLINELLRRDPSFGTALLNHVCVINSEFHFVPEETIQVTTQEVTKHGTPDIKISSPDKLMYIEVRTSLRTIFPMTVQLHAVIIKHFQDVVQVL